MVRVVDVKRQFKDDGQTVSEVLVKTTDMLLQPMDLSPEEIQAAKDAGFLAIARSGDTPEGFEGYWNYMTGSKMPKHGRMWVEGMYDAKKHDMGVLVFAFRGSWKTTLISILFTSWRMGWEPEKTNLIIGNNDDSATNITAAIARIIEHDPRWLDIFPNVRPDKKQGWGAKGYFIRDVSLTKHEWARMTTAVKDPSLLGLGITSGSVIGKHPSGVMVLDDIHDQKNTESDLERANVIVTVTDTILPLATEDKTREEGAQLVTWIIVVGTPWKEDDAYYYLKDTGEFLFLNTPVMDPVDEDHPAAVKIQHKQIDGYFKLAWPEHIPVEGIKSLYNRTGHRGFGRMYLLSLTMANELGLNFHSFPHQDLPKWTEGIWVAGLDYATILELRGKPIDVKNRTKFALVHGCIIDGRIAVVTGGVFGHYTQLQAENQTERVVNQFKNFRQLGIEMNGKGEEFASLIARKPDISPYIYPYWTGKQNKKTRLEMELGPWLELGKIRISDEETPFLNEMRRALWEFPYGNLDIIDGLFGLAKTIPDVLQTPATPRDASIPRPGTAPGFAANPFNSLGRRPSFRTMRN